MIWCWHPLKNGYLEACQVLSRDGTQVYICYYDRPSQVELVAEDLADCGHAPCLMMKASSDRGRNWGEPWILRGENGQKLTGYHQSLLRLPSGALGIIYSAWDVPGHHTGRDFGTSEVFRSSEDEGRSWSVPTVLRPTWSLCCTGHALVLSNGQIVAPMTKWISH